MVTIYAPASIGNINVGFDTLGAAILPIDRTLLGDFISIKHSDVFSIKNKGRFVSQLPNTIKDNIVHSCWEYFCNTIGNNTPIAITLEKNVPIGSGLGSSACSIVASLMAMNEFFRQPLNNNDLLKLMGMLEGNISGSIHYDNVAPSFLGGMQLIIKENDVISQGIPCFDEWLWVVAYPGITISTSAARAILPDQYSIHDTIKHSRLLAGFIHSCHTDQPMLAAQLMQDIIAEPYRNKLLPGFNQACQVSKNIGAITCGISGSGPTFFAICNEMKIAKKILNWLNEYYLKNTDGFVYICHLDKAGARKLG